MGGRGNTSWRFTPSEIKEGAPGGYSLVRPRNGRSYRCKEQERLGSDRGKSLSDLGESQGYKVREALCGPYDQGF